MTNPELLGRWRDDEQVLARIGAALFPQDTTCRVRLPADLVDGAVVAWRREDDDGTAEEDDDGSEHAIVRERAAALALLGAQLEPLTATTSGEARGEVEATLDAWYIGVALGAADDHDLIGASDPVRPSLEQPGPVGFSLWLEFEHTSDPIDDFCNVGITLSDGSAYALNVWTFDFVQALASGRVEDASGELTVGYTRPPDLLVRELTRGQITNAIAHLMANGGLPPSCRLPAG